MLKRLIEILNEKGLDANSFFFIYGLLNKIQDNNWRSEWDQDRLLELNLISLDEETVDINMTYEGIELVKYVVKELKKEIRKEIKQGDIALREGVKEWIDEYRFLFKGTKAGAIGDPKSCLDKMVRFFEEYPQFANKEQIINAAKAYIQSESAQNYKYLQRADYFIYKVVGKEETSRLASYCEEDRELEQSFTKML